jgi:hypothetical protein
MQNAVISCHFRSEKCVSQYGYEQELHTLTLPISYQLYNFVQYTYCIKANI